MLRWVRLQIVCPVLFLVGLEDKRVPPFQSMEAFHYLRARGVDTRCVLVLSPFPLQWFQSRVSVRHVVAAACRMLVYEDDNHGLTKPGTDFDVSCNIVAFLCGLLSS